MAAVDFNNEILVTGHEDSTVGIWDMTRRPVGNIRVLRGHVGGVTGVVINGKILASSSYDGSVKVWSLLTFYCLQTFNGMIGRIN